MKRALTFFSREWRHSETNVTEEYCWAMTQEAGRSCRGRSGSSVMEFGFELDSLVYTYIVDRMYTEFRLAPDLAQCNYCVSRWMSVLFIQLYRSAVTAASILKPQSNLNYIYKLIRTYVTENTLRLHYKYRLINAIEINRIKHARIPMMALEYQPKGKRDVGRPKTRWSDQQHLQDWVLTGQDPGVLHLFTLMMMMMMMMMMK